MAITCPRCGAEFDATLFQFGHRVRCRCGAEIEYPGTDQRGGHVLAQSKAEAVSHEDRCIGCLLGTACGDILGAAVEGSSSREIRDLYGELRDFADAGRGFGCYTDDTQMTLALATSLVEHGRVDATRVSAKYAEFYESWRGNGGAMRIAPVGLAYRNAAAELLLRAVEDALLCTHVHPEAIDGALVQAKAVAIAATTDPKALDPLGMTDPRSVSAKRRVMHLPGGRHDFCSSSSVVPGIPFEVRRLAS